MSTCSARPGEKPRPDVPPHRSPSGRQTALPAPPARVVSPLRARSAVAPDEGSVPHPRLRGDAAADAGRSRAAEVSRSGCRSTRRSRRWPRRKRPTSPTRGGRSATTSGRSGSTPSPASRWRATAASCPRMRRRCSRSRASASTRPAPSSASPSASAPRFSTPTSRACSFACSSAAARSRATR